MGSSNRFCAHRQDSFAVLCGWNNGLLIKLSYYTPLHMKKIQQALTYDDVLILPRRSSFRTRNEAVTKTRLTKKISINTPLVSANMDTVTESEMAIALARLGGIGVIHRFMTIGENGDEIRRVKRAQQFIIPDPYVIDPDSTIDEARNFIEENGVSGLLVADGDRRLKGVLSNRDFLFVSGHKYVRDIMTPRKELFVGNEKTTFEEARETLATNKIEKLPLVDKNDCIIGMITVDDIKHCINFPLANIDPQGQLLVGGSVGVHGDYIERAQELIKAGANFLVIDIAHGHSVLMLDAIKCLRAACGDCEIIAGNIATGDAARDLCEAGVDAIKVGVGPGTTCITRIVTGCGVPQLTAVMNCSEVAQKYGVPVIADGGIQKPGDIVKAIGGGADTVMLGGLLAGTLESPGVIVTKKGYKYKVCRGSASFAVAQRRQKIRLENRALTEITPEGVESFTPYKGHLREIYSNLIGGLKSGMSYTDSHSIEELQRNVEFVQITAAGQRESGPHDLID